MMGRCGPRPAPPARVERTLHGATDHPFETILLDVPPQECVQFRDTVPADTLPPGGYRYQARILAGGESLATQAVAFEIGD